MSILARFCCYSELVKPASTQRAFEIRAKVGEDSQVLDTMHLARNNHVSWPIHHTRFLFVYVTLFSRSSYVSMRFWLILERVKLAFVEPGFMIYICL